MRFRAYYEVGMVDLIFSTELWFDSEASVIGRIAQPTGAGRPAADVRAFAGSNRRCSPKRTTGGVGRGAATPSSSRESRSPPRENSDRFVQSLDGT